VTSRVLEVNSDFEGSVGSLGGSKTASEQRADEKT
jgi:hypothetical protein